MKMQNMDMCLREVLNRKTTKDLDAQLQAELCKEMPSEDLVLAIMDILQERESEYPVQITDTVLESWGRYKRQCSEDNMKRKTSTGWRALSAVAAGILVLIALSATIPKAVGAENIFQLIARWTETAFSFSWENSAQDRYVYKTDHPGLQQVYDLVAGLGVTEPVVPMWVPDEFELVEVEVKEYIAFKRVYARLSSNKNVIALSFNVQKDSQFRNYAKDNSAAKCYEFEGIYHYIVSNDGALTATWTRGNVECAVLTDCQEEILYKILHAIYETGVAK